MKSRPVKQRGLFDERPIIGPKMTAEYQRQWRAKNRERVRTKDRERARTRNKSDYMKAWRKKNRAKLAAKEHRAHLKVYGLTPESYATLVVAQNNCCAICSRSANSLRPKNHKQSQARLDIDHCHATGKVRALLCYNCNAILGHARDTIGTLERAVAYLRSHGVRG
jgi:hypothetical protein